MAEQPNSAPPDIDRMGPWVIVTAIIVGALVVVWDNNFSSVFQVLPAPSFFRGFVVYLVQSFTVSVFGGGLGVLLGTLIRRSEWLTVSTIRFLRLVMWLPFFVFWALPIWGAEPSKGSEINNALTNILAGTVASVPVVLLGACYYYHASRELHKSEKSLSRFYVVRSIFPLSLLLCLLWQLFMVNPWPWAWVGSDPRSGLSWLTAILIATVVILGNFFFHWSIVGAADLRRNLLRFELRNSSSHSLKGVCILSVVCLVAWQLFQPALKAIFPIEPPLSVGAAIFDFLVIGHRGVSHIGTIWSDIYVSSVEIIGGIVLATVLAFPICEGFVRNSRLAKIHWIVLAMYVAPAVLVVPIILAFGVGLVSKMILICAIVLFPLARALWSYTNLGLVGRLLLAVDEALPYAFLSMFFAEAYAATAGLGFLILVTRAMGFIAGALAIALITFGLLVFISSMLQFAVKRLVVMKPQENVVEIIANG